LIALLEEIQFQYKSVFHANERFFVFKDFSFTIRFKVPSASKTIKTLCFKYMQKMAKTVYKQRLRLKMQKLALLTIFSAILNRHVISAKYVVQNNFLQICISAIV